MTMFVQVDTMYLRVALRKLDAQGLLHIRRTLHIVYDQCIRALGSSIQIKAANGMLTLGILLQEAFAKQGFKNFAYDVIDVIVGYVCVLSG